HGRRALVAARLLALGLLAPRRYRVTTCRRFTFTTTVRVIDRVHDHTANGRTNTAPAHRTSLADLAQAVLGIADFTNRCTAFDVDATNLARTQTNLRINAFTCHQHHTGAGGTRNLQIGRAHV